MSINKTQLAADIKALLDNLKESEDQEDAITAFSDTLADKVADAIKRGIDTATIVQAQTAGGYPVTGTLTITATK